MHADDFPLKGDMGMRVIFGRFAVGCPSSMADADESRHLGTIIGFID